MHLKLQGAKNLAETIFFAFKTRKFVSRNVCPIAQPGSKKETPEISSESLITSLYIRYSQLDRFIS